MKWVNEHEKKSRERERETAMNNVQFVAKQTHKTKWWLTEKKLKFTNQVRTHLRKRHTWPKIKWNKIKIDAWQVVEIESETDEIPVLQWIPCLSVSLFLLSICINHMKYASLDNTKCFCYVCVYVCYADPLTTINKRSRIWKLNCHWKNKFGVAYHFIRSIRIITIQRRQRRQQQRQRCRMVIISRYHGVFPW